MAAEEEMVTKLAIFLVRRNVTSARLEKIVLLLALKYLPINRGEVGLRRREADWYSGCESGQSTYFRGEPV